MGGICLVCVATKHIFSGSERVATKRVTPEGTKLTANLFNKANCAAPANSVLAFFIDVFARNQSSCPNTDANASLLADAGAVAEETQGYFYHADHLGSIGIVTHQGKLYDYSVFLPFGEQWTFQSQNTASIDQGLNPLSPFQFTGKELDKYTGLTYFGARYYDPRTSIWMSTDTILDAFVAGEGNGGVFNSKNLNLYSYTYQNPINLTDPDGNMPGYYSESMKVISGEGEKLANYSATKAAQTDNPAKKAAYHVLGYTGEVIKTAPDLVVPSGGAVTAGAKRGVSIAKAGIRTLAHRAQVQIKAVKIKADIPSDWIKKTTRKNDGVEFKDPNNPNAKVRLMEGNPKSPHTNSQTPYARQQSKSGEFYRADSTLGPSKDPATHIPLKDFKVVKE